MSSAESISLHPMIPLIFPEMERSKDDPKKVDPDAAWYFYSHLVRRNPSDLTLHTHRVFFAMKHKNASLLPGSLHDLFYILKDAGENLRIRLLKASAPYLSKKDIVYFAMWIKVGIKKGMGYKWVPGAVLSNGLFGPDKTLLEMNQTDETRHTLSPLEEARSCMEYGQLDVAKDILEQALENDSENEALQEELQYLARYTKSREIQPKTENPKGAFSRTLGKIKDVIFH